MTPHYLLLIPQLRKDEDLLVEVSFTTPRCCFLIYFGEFSGVIAMEAKHRLLVTHEFDQRALKDNPLDERGQNNKKAANPNYS